MLFGRGVLRVIPVIAVTLFGLLLVTFVIGRFMPQDPVLAIVGDRATAEVYQRVYLELGLDKPIWTQFWIYAKKAITGDLGISVLTTKPVIEDIARFFPATLELSTMGTFIGVLFGVPAGVMAAVYQGRWPDYLVRFVGLLGYSAPVFWLSLMGLLIFYANLGWVSGPGRLDVVYQDLVDSVTGVVVIDAMLAGEWEVAANAFSHLILPSTVLGYYSMAYISRMTRSFMVEQLRSEYVTTARVKGMSEFKVIWRHALGNIAVPLITVIALSYANLLEGSVLTETVFAWPGLGQYITSSLLNADMNAVLGGTLVVGVTFIVINIFCDILYRLVDPRAK
ncbi:ABC transporter permease [Lacibacterium aquatile]|uniref:ABC transporter permease n=1 Tax=Lacibacterium aquatile TaxID=1168082 RepID=A0ABW5DQI2_9PROT